MSPGRIGAEPPGATSGGSGEEAPASRAARRPKADRRRLERLRDGFHDRAEARESLAQRWSWLRLGAFLVGASLSLSALLMGRPTLLAAALIAWPLAFLWAVRLHRGHEDAAARLRRWARLHDRHSARIALDWSRLPVAAHPVADPAHPFEGDLDVTGEMGLHRYLDCCASEGGSRRLHAWLREPVPDAEAIEARQAVVRELVWLTRFRLRLELLGRQHESDETHYRADRLLAFIGAPTATARLRRWALGLSLLAAVNLLLFAFAPALGGAGDLWRYGFSAYLLLSLVQLRWTAPIHGEASAIGDGLRQLLGVLRHVAEADFSRSPRLDAQCRPIREASHDPRRLLLRASGVIAGASLRGNVFVWLPLNALFPLDHLVAWRLHALREDLAGSLPGWLETWHRLEAMSALANLAWLHPESRFPTLLRASDGAPAGESGRAATGDPVLRAEGLGHPLLPGAQKVRNDIAFERLGQVALLTGSNMSGKSTFLRTLGLNLALAQAGGPVDARRFDVRPQRIFCCIRVVDSVTDGISYFYAEVRRLRALLDCLEDPEGPPTFFLVDEIFRGTNNRERLQGSRAMLRALTGKRGVGLITTHDLDLVALADEIPTLRNLHFRERIEGERMRFDFRLREGPCPTTNALRLMKQAGLPVAFLDDPADDER